MRVTRWVVLAALATRPLGAQPAEPDGRVPLLVTVMDLPIGSPEVKGYERRRTTESFLRAFRKYRVKAVGFVCWARSDGEADDELLGMWLRAGHELANFGVRPSRVDGTSFTRFVEGAEEGRRRLEALLAPHGARPRFFRFREEREGPSREKLEAMRAYLASSGQRNLPRTIVLPDAAQEYDWREARRLRDTASEARALTDFEAMLRIAVEDAEKRSRALFGERAPQVLTLHACDFEAEVAERLLSALSRRYRFATADEVLADRAFQEKEDLVTLHGFSRWERLAAARRPAEARASAAEALRRLTAAWNRGDAVTVATFWAEDCLAAHAGGAVRGRADAVARFQERAASGPGGGALELEVLESRSIWGTEPSVFGDEHLGSVQGISALVRFASRPRGKPETKGRMLVNLRPRGAMRNFWEITEVAEID